MKDKVILANHVEVSFFPENGTLEKMLELANTNDFLQETEDMKTVGKFPPFNLLVYDDFVVLGLYMQDDSICVGIREYSNNGLIDWIDMALSLRKHPARVVEKTSVKGEMFDRLKPRLDLDWIEYDTKCKIIREINDVDCPAVKFLKSMPPKKDLYSLMEYKGKIEVVHMRIDDNKLGLCFGELCKGLRCEGLGKEILDGTYESVEEKLKTDHPDALVLREPLIYCSHGTDSVPYSCLEVHFERIYAEKIGFSK